MATFNIPGQLIVAGAVRASASRRPGVNFNGATVTLTNPNGDWPSTIERVALSGTVSTTAGLLTLTGVGTAFTTEVLVDHVIRIGSSPFEDRRVEAILSDTSLTVTSAFDFNLSGGTASKTVRHILQWGFQQSPDDVNWEWGPLYAGQEERPWDWLPFGLHPKDNPAQMPNLGIDSSDFIGGSGTRLRLAILTDANVRLGAQIVTS